MHSLNNRLAKLEQALKDKQQQQVSQSDAELLEAAMARLELLSDEEILRDYEAALHAPVDASKNPELAAKLAEIDEIAATGDLNALIKHYMANL